MKLKKIVNERQKETQIYIGGNKEKTENSKVEYEF